MATKFLAAFAAAMMAMTTMSANNINGNDANSSNSHAEGDINKVCVEIIGTNNYKYVYNLDENGRVANRISYQQNKSNGEWMPVAAYSVYYGQKENVLTYAEYNPDNKVFNNHPKQQVFNATEYPELIRVPKIN